MDGADRELFERSLRHATEHGTGTALDAALDDLGWGEALEIDEPTAVSLLFQLQGEANVTSSALDRLLLRALAGSGAEAGRPAAPSATSGAGPSGSTEHRSAPPAPASAGAVVLPALGGWAPPGGIDGDRLQVAGLGTDALAHADATFVVAASADGPVAVLVPTSALDLRPVQGIDPWLGLVEVSGESIVVAADSQLATGWANAVARAQVAIGHELVGASRRMLELAREHALERVQFGQPISQFQAVRHRLADTLVAIETADAVLEAAWLDGTPETAAMAKALAGRGARTAARHCQQVLAGIGFTTEHVLHRYIRRVLVLDELVGAARSLTQQLGTDLLESRRLPPLLPL